ncbi:hypothetical protein [Halochromatium roseum]|uniref:hypothetical protein n=1 Tax=Halochromatium roseum TaxID=391920 RepID=UPI0019134A70|nr:hypothetical protein [Halochromatium roseum]
MIALDTNILARFYVDDPGDPEAAKQRPIARRILMDSPSLFVPLTVTLELEWVLLTCPKPTSALERQRSSLSSAVSMFCFRHDRP